MLSLFPTLQISPHRFAFHVPTRTAICADLHIGIHDSLARRGLFLPDTDLPAMRRRWGALLESNPARIVIAGDLFDVPEPSAGAIETCMAFLRQAHCPIVVTPGNHDPANLDNMLKDIHVTIQPGVAMEELFISHGHEPLPANASLRAWVVGHQHPALTLTTAIHSAKMPCFAVCQKTAPKKRESRFAESILLLPAFCPTSLGSNLSVARHWLLPIPRPAAGDIRIFGIVEPSQGDLQVLDFGPLSMHDSRGG